jgi:hypothetical protein
LGGGKCAWGVTARLEGPYAWHRTDGLAWGTRLTVMGCRSRKRDGRTEAGWSVAVCTSRCSCRTHITPGTPGVAPQAFVKTVNYNHIMPTRYTLDVDFKSAIAGDLNESATKKVEAQKVRRGAPGGGGREGGKGRGEGKEEGTGQVGRGRGGENYRSVGRVRRATSAEPGQTQHEASGERGFAHAAWRGASGGSERWIQRISKRISQRGGRGKSSAEHGPGQEALPMNELPRAITDGARLGSKRARRANWAAGCGRPVGRQGEAGRLGGRAQRAGWAAGWCGPVGRQGVAGRLGGRARDMPVAGARLTPPCPWRCQALLLSLDRTLVPVGGAQLCVLMPPRAPRSHHPARRRPRSCWRRSSRPERTAGSSRSCGSKAQLCLGGAGVASRQRGVRGSARGGRGGTEGGAAAPGPRPGIRSRGACRTHPSDGTGPTGGRV